LIDWY